MLIEMRSIADVKPYDKNPRLNDGAIDAVAKSLGTFGWRQPIVVDRDGVIVVGHTRWKAAQRLNMTMVPVHVALELTTEQARAYRIADNQTASIADWDMELLPDELSGLQLAGFDMTLLGFDDERLAELMAPKGNEGLIDPDDVPAPPDSATTQPGDLWILGEHRLLCGDSGSAADVDRLVDGGGIQLLNSDPPYNVNVEPASAGANTGGQRPGKRQQHSWRSPEHQAAMGIRPASKTKRPKTQAKGRRLMGDFMSDELFGERLLAWFGNAARVLEPGRAFYLWGGYTNIANYPPALEATGLYFSQCIIWHKQHAVITRKDFMGDHEWCFYGWREGAAHQYFGPNNATDVWPIKKVNPSSMEHLTQKPVELAARAISFSTKPGERVLDLFGGSGSTLIAAEQQGRRAYLMEIDPLYCDVIIDRYQRFSGKHAVRESDGTPFPKAPPSTTEALR